MKKVTAYVLGIFFGLVNASYAKNTVADSLSDLLRSQPADTARLSTLQALASQYIIAGEFDTSLKQIKESETLMQKLRDSDPGKPVVFRLESGKARSLVLRGMIANRKGEYKLAMSLYHQALAISRKIGEDRGMATAYKNISGTSSNLGENEQAVKYLDSAIYFFEKAGDKRGLSESVYNKGYYYYRDGEYDKALEAAHNAEKLAEESGHIISRTHCLLLTGNILMDMNRHEEALVQFQKALELSNQTGDKLTRGYAMSSLGVVNKYLGHYEKAMQAYKDYLELESGSGNKRSIGFASSNIAFLLEDMRKKKLSEQDMAGADALLDSALLYVSKAVEMYESIGAKDELSEAYFKAGYLDTQKKNYGPAKTFLLKAIDLSEENGNRKDRMYSWLYYSELLEKTGDQGQALHFHKLYSGLRDSILNETNSKTISGLNARYESEKKDKQIALQEAGLKEARLIQRFSIAGIVLLILFGGISYYRYLQRKRLSEKLSASLDKLKQTQDELIQAERLRERENVRLRISRDIHDEIGSNLTKIALISDMAAESVKTKPEEIKNMLAEVAGYSRRVNHSLSEIVWAVNPQQDSLERLIAYMRSYSHTFLSDTGIGVRLNFPESVKDCQLHPDLKRNVFLVLKESLNNAVKYSKAKNISVDFHISGNRFDLRIEDDGVGFDADRHKEGNGLNNMKYRMEQSGCRFTITSTLQKGCQVHADGVLS